MYTKSSVNGSAAVMAYSLIALTYILGLIVIVANGFALMKLWGWFIAPTFSLPHLSLIASIGLVVIVNWATYRPGIDAPAKGDDNDSLLASYIKTWILLLSKPAVALLTGFIFSLFMPHAG